MNIENIYLVYFSPTNTTKKIVRTIGENIKCENLLDINLLKTPIKENIYIGENDLLIVGMPVFVGRIPTVCVDMLNHLKGDNSRAVVVNAYGNRDYDDALIELYDIVEKNGFKTIAAGAFIGQHSRFPEVAKNRPDKEDIKKIVCFAKSCEQNINLDREKIKLDIKGNRPYKAIKTITLNPTGDENCIECNACVRICPTEAIDLSNPRLTDDDKCISCMACVYACPYDSRGLHTENFEELSNKFYEKNKERKEPEIFL